MPNFLVFEIRHFFKCDGLVSVRLDDPPARSSLFVVKDASASRLLKKAKITPVRSIEEALEMLRAGKADAFALTRQGLRRLTAHVPGSRILEGSFQQFSTAVAVPKNRPNSLAYVTAFMEDAKASGVVQRALDNAGVAP